MQALSVTLIQTALFWEDKKRNLAILDDKIMRITEKTNLVILPEMFSTGFSMRPAVLAETMEGETVEWMKKISNAKKIILTGSIIVEENGHYFNRLIWMLPNGNYGFYDKRHLFAYAGEDQHYTAGNKRLITSVNGWKINLQICYDLRFPVWARQQSNESPEYDSVGLWRWHKDSSQLAIKSFYGRAEAYFSLRSSASSAFLRSSSFQGFSILTSNRID